MAEGINHLYPKIPWLSRGIFLGDDHPLTLS
jgi:hypothetical protein